MITHGLLVLAGLTALYLALQQYRKTQALIGNGIRTTATVVELIEEVDAEGDNMYRPRFQYTNQARQPVDFISPASHLRSPWAVGETAPMIYRPDQARSERLISYWNLYRGTILLTAIAAPLLVMGLGYFLFHLYTRDSLHPF